MSLRNSLTLLEPHRKAILVVSFGSSTTSSSGASSSGASSSGASSSGAGDSGSASGMTGGGTASESATGGTARESTGGTIRESAGGSGTVSGISGASGGAEAGPSCGCLSGPSSGPFGPPPLGFPFSPGTGGRLGSFLAASSAALAAASAAFLRYSITGSPPISESLFSDALTVPSGMSHFFMLRDRRISAPMYRESRTPFSLVMVITAGSRVITTSLRESVYWNRPARAYALRVVSMSSTLPRMSTLLRLR